MNPLAARAVGYRSYERVELEFPLGCTAIVGANGAGKSSLLDLVPLALFGSPTRSLADYLNTDSDTLEIELTFEHDRELYRVRRCYSSKGRGKSTLDFETNVVYDFAAEWPDDPSSWKPLTLATAADTQKLIEQTLGFSRETFLASAYIGQGDGDRFTSAAPSQRKSVLAEILNLGLWDRLLEKARADLRVVEHEMAAAATTVARLDAIVAQRPAATVLRDRARTARDGASELVVDADEQLEQAQQQLAVVAAAQERALTRKAEVEAARTAHAAAGEKLRQAVDAAALVADTRVELEEVAADAARIPELEREADRIRAAVSEASEARRRRDDLARQVEQREQARQRLVDQALALHGGANDALAKAQRLAEHIHEAGACDRCGQTLGAEAAARAAHSYSLEAADLDRRGCEIDAQAESDLAEIAALHEQLVATAVTDDVEDPAPVEQALAAARAAAEKRGQLQERLARLEEQAARRPELELEAAAALLELERRQQALDEAAANVGDLPTAELQVELAKRAARDAHAALEQRAADLARAEQQLEQITAAQAELDQLNEATKSLQARLDVLKLAERAYGRDGIPALIVESAAIPQLEVEANRILGELGGATAGCRVELRTQRALKTSDALRETLDIVIRTPAGDRVYETFSGGERTRLNLALRIALARLLAHRRGADSRLLAIDEPDGLDQQGMDALAAVLAGLAGDFDRILVVSHQPQLATAFDQAIEVAKDGERSRIAGATALEVLA